MKKHALAGSGAYWIETSESLLVKAVCPSRPSCPSDLRPSDLTWRDWLIDLEDRRACLHKRKLTTKHDGEV